MIKKRKTTVSTHLRTAVWDRYIGPGIKNATCSLCGIYEMSTKFGGGWDCAHIVADLYCTNVNVYYLYPTCSNCNGECKTMTLFDYLYCRERYKKLDMILWRIYEIYSEEHSDELHYYDNQMWRVIDHLYGFKRFPAGGGIVNAKQIYKRCKAIQSHKLSIKGAELADELRKNTELMLRVLDDTIVVTNPPLV